MRSIRRPLPVLVLLLASLPAFAAARSWFVSTTGDDVNGNGSIGSPFLTLGRAVSAAGDGDTVRVLPGVYRECVDASLKSLSFVATAIEADPPSSFVTIVDGTGICGGSSCEERKSLACYGAGTVQCTGLCDDHVCSTTQTQHCLLNADCPTGETCSVVQATGICTNDASASCTVDVCVIPTGNVVGACRDHPTVSCSAATDCSDLGCDFGSCDRIQGTCSGSGAWCVASADCPEGETCESLATLPVLGLGAGSSVTGFTLRGGGLSGVRLSGSGTIAKNVVTSNRATGDDGGGIHVDPPPSPPPLRCWGDTSIACASDVRCRVCVGDTSVTCTIGQDCVDAGAGSVCAERGPCLSATEVFVQDNTIGDNVADVGDSGHGGGGLIVRAAVPAGSGTRLVATGNDMARNTTSGDGGAALLLAGGEGRLEARFADDTVTSNSAHDGGGLAVKATLSGEGARADVTISASTIGSNTASGSGGGALVDLSVAGTARILASGSGVRSNHAALDGGGLLLRAAGDGPGVRRLDVEGNSVSANRGGGSGGGLDLAVTNGAESAEEGTLVASGNEVIGNSCAAGGGGLRATVASSGAAAGASMAVETNTLRGNSAGSFGGGATLVTDSEGAAGASARFVRNLLADNAATNAEVGGATGGGLFVYAHGGAGLASVAVDYGTIASNRTDAGAAAIEIESDGASGGSARVAISNSILASNDGLAIGGPSPRDAGKLMHGGTRDFHVDVAYTDVFGNSGVDYERTLRDELTRDDTDIAADPRLAPDFSLALCSGALDAADPAADFSLEPKPNGLRVNLGHLGGTAGATVTVPDVNGDGEVDGIDLLGITAAFAADRLLSPQRYYAPADLDGNGVVDGDDLAYVAAFFGFACP
ncbi:MAG: hypothetical protein LAO51_16525 [Acidobacteriia bacterium]|nr:hypothetical protein [Terriglobia bacterium]